MCVGGVRVGCDGYKLVVTTSVCVAWFGLLIVLFYFFCCLALWVLRGGFGCYVTWLWFVSWVGCVGRCLFSWGCFRWVCARVLEFGLVTVELVYCVGVFVSSGGFYVLLCWLANLVIYC